MRSATKLFYLGLSDQDISFLPVPLFPFKKLLRNFIDSGGKEFKSNNSELAKK